MKRKNKGIIKAILIVVAALLAIGASYFIVDYLIPAESITAGAEEPETRKVNFYNNYDGVYQTEEVEARLLSEFVEHYGYAEFDPVVWNDEKLFYFTFDEAEHKERYSDFLGVEHDFTFMFHFEELPVYILDEDREYRFSFDFYEDAPQELEDVVFTFIQLNLTGTGYIYETVTFHGGAEVEYPAIENRKRGIYTVLTWQPKPELALEDTIIYLTANVQTANAVDRNIAVSARGENIETSISTFTTLTDYLTRMRVNLKRYPLPAQYENVQGYFYCLPEVPSFEGWQYDSIEYPEIFGEPILTLAGRPIFLLSYSVADHSDNQTVSLSYSKITEPEPQPTQGFMDNVKDFVKENPIMITLIIGFLLLFIIGIFL